MVEDNGVAQAINVDEDPETTGVSLVVAIQCSRSAPSEFAKLKGLGAMIDAIVENSAPHEVSVVSYGEGRSTSSATSPAAPKPIVTRSPG